MSAIAASTGKPVMTPLPQYKGFAAEEQFKQTFKINALSEGIPDWKLGVYTNGSMPDGTVLSKIDTETDIAVWIRKQPFSKPVRTVNYQSKIHNDNLAYTKDINNAQYKKVEFVGGAGQGVNDTIKVKVGGKNITSDSITPKEAEILADKMKSQSVNVYAKGDEKFKQLNKVNFRNSIIGGATAGAIFTTVEEIVNVIKNRNNFSEAEFTESIKRIQSVLLTAPYEAEQL